MLQPLHHQPKPRFIPPHQLDPVGALRAEHIHHARDRSAPCSAFTSAASGSALWRKSTALAATSTRASARGRSPGLQRIGHRRDHAGVSTAHDLHRRAFDDKFDRSRWTRPLCSLLFGRRRGRRHRDRLRLDHDRHKQRLGANATATATATGIATDADARRISRSDNQLRVTQCVPLRLRAGALHKRKLADGEDKCSRASALSRPSYQVSMFDVDARLWRSFKVWLAIC